MKQIHQPYTLFLTVASILSSLLFSIIRKSSILIPVLGLCILLLIQYLFNIQPQSENESDFSSRNRRLAKLSLNAGRHNRRPGFILPAHETPTTSAFKLFYLSWLCVGITAFFTTVTILTQHHPYTGWSIESLKQFVPFYIFICFFFVIDFVTILIKKLYSYFN